ncbi:Transcriptional regulator, LysR family [Nostocoides japonicum T1-X7]|uniref:Transcriptional regulator, LysR family n=1 Tax=Nostocoides japonicum T1-X7 TaxID=1194083 RepID=A0A077M4Y7_9MICO|nr:LysR family transcriptional regulator [Tetrasphaera japonica]CCH79159.1 Transcriptional regulator, LysR family [Tetrasphaera japonica T1-X7]
MSRQYTLAQLRYFCAVARSGSMTSAAQHLNVAQSTLSSAVIELESSLGVQLFQRSPRRTLSLSPAGERLFAEALNVLEQVDNLPAIAQDDAKALRGELVVGIFEPLASFRAPQILTAFRQAYPQVEMRYIEGDLEEVRQSLSSGRCDVALTYDVGLRDDFRTTLIEHIPAHLIVAADHPLTSRTTPIPLRDVADEPFILLDLPHTRDYYVDFFQSAGIRPDIRYRLPDYETVRSFVACGLGYSLLNLRLPHDHTHAGLRLATLDLADDLPAISLVVAFPQRTRPTQKALLFERVCRKVLGRRHLRDPFTAPDR